MFKDRFISSGPDLYWRLDNYIIWGYASAVAISLLTAILSGSTVIFILSLGVAIVFVGFVNFVMEDYPSVYPNTLRRANPYFESDYWI